MHDLAPSLADTLMASRIAADKTHLDEGNANAYAFAYRVAVGERVGVGVAFVEVGLVGGDAGCHEGVGQGWREVVHGQDCGEGASLVGLVQPGRVLDRDPVGAGENEPVRVEPGTKTIEDCMCGARRKSRCLWANVAVWDRTAQEPCPRTGATSHVLHTRHPRK